MKWLYALLFFILLIDTPVQPKKIVRNDDSPVEGTMTCNQVSTFREECIDDRNGCVYIYDTTSKPYKHVRTVCP